MAGGTTDTPAIAGPDDRARQAADFDRRLKASPFKTTPIPPTGGRGSGETGFQIRVKPGVTGVGSGTTSATQNAPTPPQGAPGAGFKLAAPRRLMGGLDCPSQQARPDFHPLDGAQGIGQRGHPGTGHGTPCGCGQPNGYGLAGMGKDLQTPGSIQGRHRSAQAVWLNRSLKYNRGCRLSATKQCPVKNRPPSYVRNACQHRPAMKV